MPGPFHIYSIYGDIEPSPRACVHGYPSPSIILNQRTIKPTIRLVRSAKTQISLRIRAVWSDSSLIACAFYSLRAIQRGIMRPLPYWMDVQADLSLCWSHRSYCRFFRALAHIKENVQEVSQSRNIVCQSHQMEKQTNYNGQYYMYLKTKEKQAGSHRGSLLL